MIKRLQSRKTLSFRGGFPLPRLLRPVVRDRDEHRPLECFLGRKVALQPVRFSVGWLLFRLWHQLTLAKIWQLSNSFVQYAGIFPRRIFEDACLQRERGRIRVGGGDNKVFPIRG